jgi:hypothetical protein
MELGSRASPGDDQEEAHLRDHVQGLDGSSIERRAAVFD